MTIPNISLEGKIALVTGGRRQLGKADALRLAEAGADVAVADVVIDDDQLEGTVNEIIASGRRSIAIQADVSKKADVDHMIRQVVDTFGGIDILVNNAGISSRMTLMETTENEWDEIIDVNLKGVFLCSQAAGKRMIEQKRGGSIINLSSSTGLNTNVSRGSYGVSKAGVIMVTKLLARELGPHNIRVNAIAPGFTSTAKIGGRGGQIFQRGPEETDRVLSRLALKRQGEPIDYANTILFLASDLGSYITGVTIPIDGGFTIP